MVSKRVSQELLSGGIGAIPHAWVQSRRRPSNVMGWIMIVTARGMKTVHARQAIRVSVASNSYMPPAELESRLVARAALGAAVRVQFRRQQTYAMGSTMTAMACSILVASAYRPPRFVGMGSTTTAMVCLMSLRAHPIGQGIHAPPPWSPIFAIGSFGTQAFRMSGCG